MKMSDKGVDSLVNQNNTPGAAVLFFYIHSLLLASIVGLKLWWIFISHSYLHLKARKVNYYYIQLLRDEDV